MAAVLPNPIRLQGRTRRRRTSQQRRDQILGQMRGLGGPDYLNELENPTAPPKAAAKRRQVLSASIAKVVPVIKLLAS